MNRAGWYVSSEGDPVGPQKALTVTEAETDAATIGYLHLMKQSGVPEHLEDGLLNYVLHRKAPGSFLKFVLENNLKDAIARGDHVSTSHLREIVGFLFNYAPHNCWGSPAVVERWLSGKF